MNVSLLSIVGFFRYHSVTIWSFERKKQYLPTYSVDDDVKLLLLLLLLLASVDEIATVELTFDIVVLSIDDDCVYKGTADVA